MLLKSGNSSGQIPTKHKVILLKTDNSYEQNLIMFGFMDVEIILFVASKSIITER